MKSINFKKATLILSSMFLGASLYLIGESAFDFLGSLNSKDLAKVELDLRKNIENLKSEYEVKTSVIRKKDAITVRILDKGLFSTSDWRFSKKGKSFIEDFVSSLDKIKKPQEIKIDSHYDSTDPVTKNNVEFSRTKLSNYRAVQIANVFANKGFDIEKISYRGLADKVPVVNDRDNEGAYIAKAGDLNRRLEITFKMKSEKL